MTELALVSARHLGSLIRAREVSCLEVVADCINRIEHVNHHVNAFVTILAESALVQAGKADAAIARGADLGPLHGVPVALKDMDMMKGVRHTRGSRLLANNVAPLDSIHVKRLCAAGAIVLGMTNTPEFGHKGTTDNLLFGPTSTPFRIGHNSGGSSGGSAAAVAARLGPLATGGDGGGSIRIPAALCGVYGFKPSFGRVPVRTRPDAFQWHAPFVSLGPLARSVRDAALMMDAMAGPAEADPLSVEPLRTKYVDALEMDLRGVRVGYSPDLGGFPVERPVAELTATAAAALSEAGVSVEPVAITLPRSPEELGDVWVALSSVRIAEMAEHLAAEGIPLLDRSEEVSAEFIDLIHRGQEMRAVDYKQLDVVRTELYEALQGAFEQVDLLLTPTVAVGHVENATDGTTVGPKEIGGQTVEPLVGWGLAFPINFTGHPAASVPAGLTSEGDPVGIQVVGRRFRDDMVLRLSAEFEQCRPWEKMYEEVDRALERSGVATGGAETR